MKLRFLLAMVLAAVLCISFWSPDAANGKDGDGKASPALEIGSKAPSLDIEHWIQDGNGFFKPVTDFEKGKVYVIEFWATWCGPCIMSMPHLAELQEHYRGQGVQIVSVSDETVDEVKDLLGREHEQVKKTFGEITSAYSLTTDPDRSVHTGYMDAANQDGIPTAFIVGKTGLIEWIGHPGNMDEPLEQVVNDAWDREAFQEQLRVQEELQENMEKMSRLAGAGKFDEAIELVNTQIEDTSDKMLKEHWIAIQHSLKLSSGKLDEETLAFYRDQMKQMKGDAESLIRFGYSLFGITRQGAEVGELASEAVAAIEAEEESIEDDIKPMYYNTIALLSDVAGNLDKAIEAQTAAVEASDKRQKRRLMPLLEELKEKKTKKEKKTQEVDEEKEQQ